MVERWVSGRKGRALTWSSRASCRRGWTAASHYGQSHVVPPLTCENNNCRNGGGGRGGGERESNSNDQLTSYVYSYMYLAHGQRSSRVLPINLWHESPSPFTLSLLPLIYIHSILNEVSKAPKITITTTNFSQNLRLSISVKMTKKSNNNQCSNKAQRCL